MQLTENLSSRKPFTPASVSVFCHTGHSLKLFRNFSRFYTAIQSPDPMHYQSKSKLPMKCDLFMTVLCSHCMVSAQCSAGSDNRSLGWRTKRVGLHPLSVFSLVELHGSNIGIRIKHCGSFMTKEPEFIVERQ